MSQRVLITTALAFGAGFAVASVPSIVPGSDASGVTEHREVRRTVRRVRRSHEDADGIPVTCEEHDDERRARRSRRERRTHREPEAQVDGPIQTVHFDPGAVTYEDFSGLGRALAHVGSDGQQDGYRLFALRPGSLASELGLRNGDVVTHVGGIPLTSMDRAIEAFQASTHASEVTLQLIRGGRTQRLRVALT